MTYWAKLHTDILGDPKLMNAAERGVRYLELLPWLLAYAKRVNAQGRLANVGETVINLTSISSQIPLGPRAKSVLRVRKAIANLEAIGVLSRADDGVPYFVNWARRQGQTRTSPSDTREAWAARQRASRARHARDTSDVTPNVTRDVTHANVTTDVELRRRELQVRGSAENVTPVTSLKPPNDHAPEAASRPLPNDPHPFPAAANLISRLGTNAAQSVYRFLDGLPPGQSALAWIQFLDAGCLDGISMPDGQKVSPRTLRIAVEDFLNSPRHEYPYTRANVRAFIARVDRAGARANGAGSSGAGRSAEALAQANRLVTTRRAKDDGADWWTVVRHDATLAGVTSATETVLYAAEHLDRPVPRGDA